MTRPDPKLGEVAADLRAQQLARALTPNARVILSRLKERSAVALSLAEMAFSLKPNLPGLVRTADGESFVPAPPSSEKKAVMLNQGVSKRRGGPIEFRFLPDGGLRPELFGDPAWEEGLQISRAVVVELETLELICRLEVRGASISEKWTLTSLGKKVCNHVRVSDWRMKAVGQ